MFCRLALVNLIVSSATELLASLQLQCSFHAAEGALEVSAQPAPDANLSQGERPVLSAAVSGCIPESSAASRRMKPVLPAINRHASQTEASAGTAGMAALIASMTVSTPTGLAAICAATGATSEGLQGDRSAVDSGLVLNPATLASIVQAQRSAVCALWPAPGAASREPALMLTAIDIFAAETRSRCSLCEALALLIAPPEAGSISATFTGSEVDSSSQLPAQHRSVGLAGIRLRPSSPSPQRQPLQLSADMPVSATAGGMLYEVAWLADAVPVPTGHSVAAAEHGRDGVANGSPARCQTAAHAIAALDSRGGRSVRALRFTRHAAATAMCTLEALQRFTGDAAILQARLCSSSFDHVCRDRALVINRTMIDNNVEVSAHILIRMLPRTANFH